MVIARLEAPPEFLALGAEPIRWALLRELSESDRQVDELVAAVGKPQNLVSYHLGKLRAANVVSVRRSSHDGRGMYYRLDIPRCAELLAGAARSLHLTVDAAPPAHIRTSTLATSSVLFLCTANSARSQMAEGLLRAVVPGDVRVASAGVHPTVLHPGAVRVMQARGIDISQQVSKHLDTLGDQPFDVVVTVCDHVKEECPDFPGRARLIHWSIPDPVSEGADAGKRSAFERVADELTMRVEHLVPLLATA